MKTKQERQELFEQREAVRKAKYAERMAAIRERDAEWKAERGEVARSWRGGPSFSDRVEYRFKVGASQTNPLSGSLVWWTRYKNLPPVIEYGFWAGEVKP